MKNQTWLWYGLLGLLYLSLGWMVFSFYTQSQDIRSHHQGENLDAEFAGNDWVTWENTEKGVVATRVHPLPSYRPSNYTLPEKGDRLRAINDIEVRSAEMADEITEALSPGSAIKIALERTDPFQVVEDIETLIPNGFRLTYSFNSMAIYWNIFGWIVGIGAFITLIILAILFPIVRSNWVEFLTLLGVVVSALLFFLLQLFHHLYLVLESDAESIGAEKLFILLYPLLAFAYIIFYFHFKSQSKKVYFLIPSILVALYLLWSTFQIVYVDEQMRYFHTLLEKYTAIFMLLHMACGVGLYLVGNFKKKVLPGNAYLGVVLLVSVAGLIYLSFYSGGSPVLEETFFMAFNLLLFFPLANASFFQIQFGKVSVVVTQTLQYLVSIVISIIIYLLITQLFDYFRPSIQYRQILEFVTFVFVIVILRLVYLANENKFRRYFVSPQQERLTRFKSFIARIPQYTNASMLRRDLVEEMLSYFNAETVHLWWSGDRPESVSESRYHEKQEEVYQALTANNTIWSKTKELATFRLDPELEKMVLPSPYTLLCPITVDDANYALLMLGKKKSGVYNLLDLELISQLIQQTQLTLNVLQLVDREKELIQQTYEANLTALRSQINPHFLFNTLNSIGELVHESADLAEEAVEKLAYIFRYTLNKSSENFVAVADEMRLITTYLDLEKIRFGERLSTEIDIAPAVEAVQVPSFIISTLVENCIKHGISKILHPGLVTIKAFQEDNFLICEVIDNGPGIDLTRIHKSHGLSSSISRLENIYH
ncbi:MAG: histidine kinase, partial [Bacteroidota bacterium]